MGKKHPGRQTEFAKFRRNMARLEAYLAERKAENAKKKRGKDGNNE